MKNQLFNLQSSPIASLAGLIHSGLLVAYVASLPFSTLSLGDGISVSFLLATSYILVKFGFLMMAKPRLFASLEVFVIFSLLSYLIIKEIFFSSGNFNRGYYGTYVLNFMMFAALLDDFLRKPAFAIMCAIVFSAVMVLIGTYLAIGWGTRIGDMGRVTFLNINENELALCFFFAFSFIAAKLFESKETFSRTYAILLGLSAVLIAGIVESGTRFVLFLLFVQLSVLLCGCVLAALRGNAYSRKFLTVAIFFIFAICMTFSSEAMMARLDPSLGIEGEAAYSYRDLARLFRGVDFLAGGSNFTLADGSLVRAESSGVIALGGRLLMWTFAFNAFLEEPIWGMGYFGFRQMQLDEFGYFALPHNLFLEIAAIGGLVGCFLLIALVALLVKRLYISVAVNFSYMWMLIFPLIGAAMFLNIVAIKFVWFALALYVSVNAVFNFRGETR